MTATPPDSAVDAVLGLESAAKLSQFSTMARISAMAPDIDSRVAMARRAAVQIDRIGVLGELIAERGGDQMVLIASYISPFDSFGKALQPADWWEALVLGYIEQGVAFDIETALIDGLGAPWTERLGTVRATGKSRERVERIVASTAASDARWKSRLSLWGRRVVGEALSVVQHIVLDDPQLSQLVARFAGGDASRMHQVLSAHHATRMARLGLTA